MQTFKHLAFRIRTAPTTKKQTENIRLKALLLNNTNKVEKEFGRRADRKLRNFEVKPAIAP